MSASAQHNCYIYHTSLADLMQGVQGGKGPLAALLARVGRVSVPVYVESLSVREGLVRTWGVLVTARRRDEILSAWCVADQEQDLWVDQARHAQAIARQQAVRGQIERLLRQAGLCPMPGAYDVPERAFHLKAALPEGAAAPAEKGGRS